MKPSEEPFPGFSQSDVTVQSECLKRDIQIHALKGGSGPPLLLLHGYPQCSYLWRRVAPELAKRYTVVVTDLRGYGDSDKPGGSSSHVEYSKKEMAADQVQVMKSFGFDNFLLCGHDRGARVAHRLALDHPKAVRKLMILDIQPTLWMYEHTNMTFATGYWHWFFLIQPSPFPEEVILGNPEAYWKMQTSKQRPKQEFWNEIDVKEYQRLFFRHETVHASCEDYRAAATIDLEHDREDLKKGNKLSVPAVRILWGKSGMIEKMGNVLGAWKEFSHDDVQLSGRSVECGHYIPEEAPEELLEELLDFMK